VFVTDRDAKRIREQPAKSGVQLLDGFACYTMSGMEPLPPDAYRRRAN
jgi:hypothetical protein